MRTNFILKIITKGLAIISVIFLTSTSSFALETKINILSALIDTNANTIRNQGLLSAIPAQKGTVGTVMVYRHNNIPYVLLGRERIDSFGIDKAGTFSDLGGSTMVNGGSYAVQTVRELTKESVDSYHLTTEDLIKKAYVIYKNNNGRDIVYSIYPLNEEEYNISKNLNLARSAPRADLPASFLEKDLFVWVPVKTLLHSKNQEEFDAIDIEGKTTKIKLRKYFVNDCLNHPDFLTIMEKFAN